MAFTRETETSPGGLAAGPRGTPGSSSDDRPGCGPSETPAARALGGECRPLSWPRHVPPVTQGDRRSQAGRENHGGTGTKVPEDRPGTGAFPGAARKGEEEGCGRQKGEGQTPLANCSEHGPRCSGRQLQGGRWDHLLPGTALVTCLVPSGPAPATVGPVLQEQAAGLPAPHHACRAGDQGSGCQKASLSPVYNSPAAVT